MPCVSTFLNTSSDFFHIQTERKPKKLNSELNSKPRPKPSSYPKSRPNSKPPNPNMRPNIIAHIARLRSTNSHFPSQLLLSHEHADAILGLDDVRGVQVYSPHNDVPPLPVYCSQHCFQRLEEAGGAGGC